jgi:hypothetical protein
MASFIALHRTQETVELLRRHPKAFLLLTQIALRAKWRDCAITQLREGESFIGDWRECGLESESSYRHAKRTLEKCGIATFRATNKGTVASLVSTRIFSTQNDDSDRQNDRPATGQRQASDRPTATNVQRYKDTKTHGSTTSPESQPTNRTPEPTGPDYANPEFFDNLQGKVRGLSREWSKPFMRSEMEELAANAEFFASVSEPEWIDLRFFMSAKTIPPELDAKAYWRPNSRLMFIRNAADMAAKAANFRRECRKAGYEVPEHPKDQP